MSIIDAHIHFSNVQAFQDAAKNITFVDYSGNGYRQSCLENEVIASVAMGLTETSKGGFPDDDARNPMGLDLEQPLPDNLFCCPGINPIDLRNRGNAAIQDLRHVFSQRETIGIKLYAGYYPFYVHDDIYASVYQLAKEYQLPIVIHGGVTYSDRGLLKYSHPLSFDEAIVKHRDLTFVICHMGEPWLMDTAAIMSKSPNVMADLSGLLVTDAPTIARKAAETVENDRFRQPLVFEERYDRFLFGSDWPLAPLGAYIEFIRSLIPQAHHEDVFRRNALRTFPRLASALAL